MRIIVVVMAVLTAGNIGQSLDLQAFQSELPEYGLVQGPDGYYLTRQAGAWGTKNKSEIVRFSKSGTLTSRPTWTEPSADETAFHYSKHQEIACYVSDRLSGQMQKSPDIWCLEWLGDRWGKPYVLPPPVNSSASEYSPVIRPNGDIYFASDRDGGSGLGDIYLAHKNQEEWSVENLGSSVNSRGGEWNLGVSPDGRLLIFESSHRDTNRTISGDLYSSRLKNGEWSPAVPLSSVNTDGSDLMPRFLSDDTVVFASSFGADVRLRFAKSIQIDTSQPIVAAVSRSSGEVVLLEPESLSVIRRIRVGTGPHDIASSEDGRLAIVPLHGIFPAPHEDPIAPGELRWTTADSEGFTTVDLLRGKPLGTQAMVDCLRPHGAAATAQAHRVWITCENQGQIREIDPLTGKTIRYFSTSAGVHKVMHLSKRNMLAASNPKTGEAYLIDIVSGEITTFQSGGGAEALAANEDHSAVYVANSFDRTVCHLDVILRRLDSCRSTGGKFPIALAVDADRDLVWIAHNASSNVVALAFESGEIVETIDLPSRPLGMAFDAHNRRLYVGLPRRNEVLLIDADTGKTLSFTNGIMEVDDIDLIPAAYFEFSPDT
jgi:DNA-binding beta-propeller fold protein YncE